jgi:hypothetical protein
VSDVHEAPGRWERWLLSRPDGAAFRIVFLGVVALAGTLLAQDVLHVAGRTAETDRTRRTEPLPLSRPVPGDQIRPYLPRAIPVGPDRGVPVIPGFEGPLDTDATARRMRFVRTEPDVIAAVGRIDRGTADDLRRFLDGEGKGANRLVLQSPGGSVTDAIEMARLLRERSFSTSVPADGYCASACPLVLAGGTGREAGEGAWIGVHQVYAAGETPSGAIRDLDRSIAEIQATSAACQQLLLDMGVDPQLWIKAMQTPAAELYVLTKDELASFRMVAVPPVEGS